MMLLQQAEVESIPHSPEAERGLVGSLFFADAAVWAECRLMIGKDDFFDARYGILFDVMAQFQDRGQTIDAPLIVAELRKRKLYEELGGLEQIAEILFNQPGASAAVHYANVVRDRSLRRRMMQFGSFLYQRAIAAADLSRSADEIATDAAASLAKLITENRRCGDVKIGSLLASVREQIDSGGVPMVPTGFRELDAISGGVGIGEMMLIGARPSMGKAQPLDAKILKTTGWAEMGSLRIGDELASIDGERSIVTGIFPRGIKQVYRVTFCDGRSTECCAEHLWEVTYREWESSRVVSTSKLAKMLQAKRNKHRLYIPTFSGTFSNREELPIDPWVLGALIGDASICGRGIQFCSADSPIVCNMRRLVGDDINISKKSKYGYTINGKPGIKKTHRLKKALMDFGLWGCESDTKFIPDCYLSASLEDREALLAGLLDTDGWIESFGTIRYATCSKRLARDVVELARSIGGAATFYSKKTTYSHKGIKKSGKLSYVCNIQVPDVSRLPLSHPEKKERIRWQRTRSRRINVMSIEPTRTVEVQCITVSHPSQLYVTDDFIVTHNSTILRQIAIQCARAGNPVGFISLEESASKIGRNWLSSESGVENQKIRTGRLVEQDWQEIDSGIMRLKDLPVFITDETRRMGDIRARATAWKARYGIKVLIIDYLQRIGGVPGNSRYEIASNISTGVSDMLKEIGLAGIVAVQLNRALDNREDKRPSMSDIRESGQIEQDADGIVFLHREDYYHLDDANYQPNRIAELIIAKWRDSVRGMVVKVRSNLSRQRFDDIEAGDPEAYGPENDPSGYFN